MGNNKEKRRKLRRQKEVTKHKKEKMGSKNHKNKTIKKK